MPSAGNGSELLPRGFAARNMDILALVAWQGQGSGHGVLAACSPTLPLEAWDFPSRSHRPLGNP